MKEILTERQVILKVYNGNTSGHIVAEALEWFSLSLV